MESMNFLKIILFVSVMFLSEINALAECKIEESTASSGGYRELLVGRNKLIDVDSFKEFDGKVFYATSPIYGRPEIGLIDCGSDKRILIVSPKNIDKFYPYGADFYRLKDITKDKKNGGLHNTILLCARC